MILVENVLGGIFWAALDSLVIAVLPLRLLEGSKIVGWSRAAWVALYGVTLLAFVHVLLRPSTGYVSNTSVSPPNWSSACSWPSPSSPLRSGVLRIPARLAPLSGRSAAG